MILESENAFLGYDPGYQNIDKRYKDSLEIEDSNLEDVVISVTVTEIKQEGS